MSKNILALLPDNVEEIELITPIDLWRRAGYQITIASLADELQTVGQQGVVITADVPLKHVSHEDYDALFLPGGSGYQLIKQSLLAMSIIEDFIKHNKKIIAICAAPTILTPWLQDKKATSYPSLKEEIPHWVDQKVVIDLPFITSQGAGTASYLAFEVIRLFSGEEQANELKKATIFA